MEEKRRNGEMVEDEGEMEDNGGRRRNRGL